MKAVWTILAVIVLYGIATQASTVPFRTILLEALAVLVMWVFLCYGKTH